MACSVELEPGVAAEKDDLVTECLVSAAGLEPVASWAVTAPVSVIAWPDGWAPGPAWRMAGTMIRRGAVEHRVLGAHLTALQQPRTIREAR